MNDEESMDKRAPIVWVLNRGSGYDFSAAERYGTLVYLSEGPIPRYAVGGMYRLFNNALRDSRPYDYILQTSLTTMNSLAAAIFVKKHGCLNLLLWKEEYYVLRRVVFD